MKKTNLKKFVQKMLILGFCVPITLVCSSIPAMAEAESAIGGQPTSENTTETTAEGSNSNSTTVTDPNGDTTVTVRNADGSIKSITKTHTETTTTDLTENDPEYKSNTNEDGVHPNKKTTSTTTTTVEEYNTTETTESEDHTNHEDYRKKNVYSVDSSGKVTQVDPNKTKSVRDFMEAVGNVQNSSVYADTFNNKMGHSDGDVIVNQLIGTNTIKNTEQIANQNHEDYGNASFSYIGNADELFDTLRNGNPKKSIIVLGNKDLDSKIASDNTDSNAYRRLYVQTNQDGSKQYYINTIDEKSGQVSVKEGKSQYESVSEDELTKKYPQLKKFEQITDINNNLSAIGMTGERVVGNEMKTAR